MFLCYSAIVCDCCCSVVVCTAVTVFAAVLARLRLLKRFFLPGQIEDIVCIVAQIHWVMQRDQCNRSTFLLIKRSKNCKNTSIRKSLLFPPKQDKLATRCGIVLKWTKVKQGKKEWNYWHTHTIHHIDFSSSDGLPIKSRKTKSLKFPLRKLTEL